MCVIIRLRPCHTDCHHNECRLPAEKFLLPCKRTKRNKSYCKNPRTLPEAFGITNVFSGTCSPIRPGDNYNRSNHDSTDSTDDLAHEHDTKQSICSSAHEDDPKKRIVYDMRQSRSWETTGRRPGKYDSRGRSRRLAKKCRSREPLRGSSQERNSDDSGYSDGTVDRPSLVERTYPSAGTNGSPRRGLPQEYSSTDSGFSDGSDDCSTLVESTSPSVGTNGSPHQHSQLVQDPNNSGFSGGSRDLVRSGEPAPPRGRIRRPIDVQFLDYDERNRNYYDHHHGR